MKKLRFNIIIALLIACNINLYAQSGFSDFLGGLAKSFTENAGKNTQKQRSYSNSSSSSGSSSNSSSNSFSINKKVTSSKTETLKDGSVGTTTIYEDGSSLYVNKGACTSCKGDRICKICGGRGTTLYKCMGCGNTGRCSYCAGTGRRHTELYTDSYGNGFLKDLVTGKTQTVYANSGGSGGGNYNSNSYSSSSSTSTSSSTSGSSRIKCKSCNGSSVCSRCHGSCGSYEWVYDTKKWMSCAACDGNGRCKICYGRGYIH